MILLEKGDPLIHPWVNGELACGNLASSDVAPEAEILRIIEAHGWMGLAWHPPE